MEKLEGTFYLNGVELGVGTLETVNTFDTAEDTAEKSYKDLPRMDSIELEFDSCYFDKKAFYKVMFNKKLRRIHNRWIHAKSRRQLKKQFKKYMEA
jgi:hypothetical protein